jgi:hypothetical protein
MITLNNKTFLPAKPRVVYSGYSHYYRLDAIPGVDYAGYEALLGARVPEVPGLVDLSKLDLNLRTKSPTTGKWRWKPGYKTKLNIEVAKLPPFTQEDYQAAYEQVFKAESSEQSTEICTNSQELIQRFSLCDIPPTSKKTNPDLGNLYYNIFYYAGQGNYAKIFATNNVQKVYTNPRLETPKVSQEESLKLLKKCGEGYRSGWNRDYPTYLEFEDNQEMLERVKEHLAPIPGLKITYLRKRWLGYFSDGGFSLTPDAINGNKTGKVIKYLQGNFDQPLQLADGSKSQDDIGQPCIYLGEAWVMHFTVDNKNVLGNGNLVAFATPEQFVKAYENARPDLLEGFIPWSDFIFISSDWCERNGSTNYSKGIDLQTPHQRRMSLLHWIIGPCASRCLRHGMPFQGLQVLNGHEHAGRIEKLKGMVAKYAPKVEGIEV